MIKFGALDAFTLRLAVGAVWLVGAFLATCGIYNIFPFVESLVRSSTWSAVVALPVLVVSYALGTIVANASAMFAVSRDKRHKRISDFVHLSRAGTTELLSRFEALRTEADFLNALVPTVVFLAGSVVWSALRLLDGGLRVACVAAALAFAASAIVVMRLARRADEQVQWLVDAVLNEPS